MKYSKTTLSLTLVLALLLFIGYNCKRSSEFEEPNYSTVSTEVDTSVPTEAETKVLANCTVPEVKGVHIIEGEDLFKFKQFKVDLILAAEIERLFYSGEVSTNPEAQLEKMLDKYSHREIKVSQEFYQWYQVKRLQICMLKELIADAVADGDHEFAKATRVKLVDLILEIRLIPDAAPIEDYEIDPAPSHIGKANELIKEMDDDNENMQEVIDRLPESKKRIGLQHLQRLHALGITDFYNRLKRNEISTDQIQNYIERTREKQYNIYKQFKDK